MAATVSRARAGPFVHPVVFYGSDEEYLGELVPFVTAGVRAREPVAVAVPGRRHGLLRAALGRHAEHITLIDMAEEGRNPGRIISGVLARFADRHPGRHVRIIGEPTFPERTELEYPACAQHEALINAAFAGRDVTILCPYDTTGLDDRALADARRTHPLVWTRRRCERSLQYDPDRVLSRYNEPLTATAGGLAVTAASDIPVARHRAGELARELGLAERRIPDLQLIVTELVTNSLLHTAGPCLLRIWREGQHLMCDVRDGGHLVDPLAGRRLPGSARTTGRGLLLVNALADLIRTHTSSEGTTQRAVLRLAG